MADSADVAVIGGGVGGLAVAIRLGAAGHRVTVFERNEVTGGKLAAFERDGFSFDIGPSLLTLPHVFDDLFRHAGTSLDEQVDLIRLDPQFHYRWSDGSTLTVHDDHADTAGAFENLCAGAGAEWRNFDDRGRRIWDVAERTFLAGPMSSPLSLLKRLRSPFDLSAIDPMRTLHRASRGAFTDRRLVQWADRYATYSGSSPYKAPATLACIPHIEARFGCWYPLGGLDALGQALERVAGEAGVEIRTGAEVVRVTTRFERVTGVELADGTRHEASIVVANVDAEHLRRDLLPHQPSFDRLKRVKRSTSGFVVCAAVRGLTPGIGHHNVWFSADGATEFAALERGELADDPTIYGCISSVTDPTQAPDGCENWFLLVNTPPGVAVDATQAGQQLIDRLAARGTSIGDRIDFTRTITPHEFGERFRSPGGAIYGTSSDGRRAAFARPANRGHTAGLYLVGGSSHPGGGLPLVTISARIVADMIESDGTP